MPIAAMLAQSPPAGWKVFTIGPSVRNVTQFSLREGLRAEGIPLRRAIALAWGIPEYLVAGPDWIATKQYAITALIAGAPDTFEPLFQKELTKAFHLEAHWEKRTEPVFALRRIGDTADPPQAGTTLKGLTQQLATVLKRPVVDETGIVQNRSNRSLRWKDPTLASISDALREQLGLRLVEASRELEFLVIDNVERVSI